MDHDRIARLVSKALDDFDSASVTSLVRQAVRIASLRHDYEGLYSLQYELVDFTTASKEASPAMAQAYRNLETLIGPEEARKSLHAFFLKQQHVRSMASSPGNQHASSVEQLEVHLSELRKVYAESVVPANLTPIDTYAFAAKMDQNKAKLTPMLHEAEAVVGRIRQKTYDYLIATEADIEAGKDVPNVFERGLLYVRASLAARAPKALDMFSAAEDRLSSGDPEELSQALTSVRRMIKELADVLYPATGEVIVGDDKISRPMSDEAYKNRLIQFAKSKLGNHGQAEVVQEMLRSFGQRLNKLDRLASKGVHDDVSIAEAESCLAWTFMLTADLLRIDDGSSPAMRVSG